MMLLLVIDFHSHLIPLRLLNEVLESEHIASLYGDKESDGYSAVNKNRERNEDLCAMERRTIDLNTLNDEFDPPFLVEIRCQNTADYEHGYTDSLVEQVIMISR
uniref:Uncharacterized protein n=1 Tax=Angiostrongylus cantonensis TaxID=6313 RepID=A0A0K0DJL6_ANGCA